MVPTPWRTGGPIPVANDTRSHVVRGRGSDERSRQERMDSLAEEIRTCTRCKGDEHPQGHSGSAGLGLSAITRGDRRIADNAWRRRFRPPEAAGASWTTVSKWRASPRRSFSSPTWCTVTHPGATGSRSPSGKRTARRICTVSFRSSNRGWLSAWGRTPKMQCGLPIQGWNRWCGRSLSRPPGRRLRPLPPS